MHAYIYALRSNQPQALALPEAMGDLAVQRQNVWRDIGGRVHEA